jgi:hypothetical protein
MTNSERFPEAWKVYNDCVRKWEETDLNEFPEGWKYGIPNPKNSKEYLYSNCPGKLFMKFKNHFYGNDKIMEFRKFLWNLELMEGKITRREYDSNIEFTNLFH